MTTMSKLIVKLTGLDATEP